MILLQLFWWKWFDESDFNEIDLDEILFHEIQFEETNLKNIIKLGKAQPLHIFHFENGILHIFECTVKPLCI